MPRKNKFATIKDIAKSVKKKLKTDDEITLRVIERFFVEIKTELLEGKKVQLNEFGSFEIKTWNSKEVYDINQKKKVEKEIKTLSFKPSVNIKRDLFN